MASVTNFMQAAVILSNWGWSDTDPQYQAVLCFVLGKHIKSTEICPQTAITHPTKTNTALSSESSCSDGTVLPTTATCG